jgi:ribonuclease HI
MIRKAVQMSLPAINLPSYKLFFDGCSKGNPGLAGAGAVIYNGDHEEVWSGSTFVGKSATNNQAEYVGLIYGLNKAAELNIDSLSVYGDSQLVIRQMTGKYKCKSPHLIDLHNEAKKLTEKFTHLQFTHVLRHLNKRADELSNEGIPINGK